MAAISQTTISIFQIHFREWKVFSALINISLEFIPKGQMRNILALVQIVAWRPTGDKPLSEPMMT